eukprot:scaffold202980_cov32-Tisochrysis_lutea.AAC.2
MAAAVVPLQPTARGGLARLRRNRDVALHTAQRLPLRHPADQSPTTLPPSPASKHRQQALAQLAATARDARLRAAQSSEHVAPAAAAAAEAAKTIEQKRSQALDQLRHAARHARLKSQAEPTQQPEGTAMRFGTHKPAGVSERADLLRAVAEKAQHARIRTLTREQSERWARGADGGPGTGWPHPKRWRCPVCNLLVPRAVRTCTSCLHSRGSQEPRATPRTLVWKKSTMGTAYKQSVAVGHVHPRCGAII